MVLEEEFEIEIPDEEVEKIATVKMQSITSTSVLILFNGSGRRVVITGLGAVSPNGNDAFYLESIVNGQSIELIENLIFLNLQKIELQ